MWEYIAVPFPWINLVTGFLVKNSATDCYFAFTNQTPMFGAATNSMDKWSTGTMSTNWNWDYLSYVFDILGNGWGIYSSWMRSNWMWFGKSITGTIMSINYLLLAVLYQ